MLHFLNKPRLLFSSAFKGEPYLGFSLNNSLSDTSRVGDLCVEPATWNFKCTKAYVNLFVKSCALCRYQIPCPLCILSFHSPDVLELFDVRIRAALTSLFIEIPSQPAVKLPPSGKQCNHLTCLWIDRFRCRNWHRRTFNISSETID